MTDLGPDTPSPFGGSVVADSTSTGAGRAAPVWGTLREIGGLGLLRLLPGVLRSVFTRGELATPGGVALRRPADRDEDHLADVGLDSAPTSETPAERTTVVENLAGADTHEPAEGDERQAVSSLDVEATTDVDASEASPDTPAATETVAPAQSVASVAEDIDLSASVDAAELGGDVDEAGLA